MGVRSSQRSAALLAAFFWSFIAQVSSASSSQRRDASALEGLQSYETPVQRCSKPFSSLRYAHIFRNDFAFVDTTCEFIRADLRNDGNASSIRNVMLFSSRPVVY